MTSKELREKYFEFFKKKGHSIIGSASLIPENDPTVLFTTAGMHPLVPFLMGEKHPQGSKLVNAQRCVRTGDINEVGDESHLTFFEMLGNWSLGDYFKKESIPWSWEFLVGRKWLGIDPGKLYVTVYEGDKDIPKDEESIDLWKKCFKEEGISARVGERIFLLGREDNWWGPAGSTGPCGPDTEIFYDTGVKACSDSCAPGCLCGKYMEIWNNVFMEYRKNEDGSYELLSQKNVDTGMGVERTVAVLNNNASVFEIDSIKPIIEILENGARLTYLESPREYRVITDHIRAAVMIAADGVEPSNKGQGYVLRRLIRRAVQYNAKIMEENFLPTKKLVERVMSTVGCVYHDKDDSDRITRVIKTEEEKFTKTLRQGMKKFKDLVASEEMSDQVISGKDAFRLFQSYGFPLEMIKELAQENNLSVDEKTFYNEFKRHQNLSREASAGKFKGGLADDSEQTKKYHTAAHLLLSGLRKALGSHVEQKGANITPERLRFDFSNPEKVPDEELRQIEDFVNNAVSADYTVECEEMPLEDAKARGAVGIFDSKYGNKVKVYTIDDVSKEICGGPHVESTGVLGSFKIIKEQSASSGVRRIKAILE